MLSHIVLYVLCARAAFTLQIPRQASVSYTNSSTSINYLASPTHGPYCCELYAPGVGLNLWYSGHNVSVNDGYIITEYLRYNNTIIPTSTITAPPTSTLYANGYLADVDGPAIIPGVPTDLNGPSYAGAYDATIIERIVSTSNLTTTAPPTPSMDFGDFFVFAGYKNSAGVCIGTNTFDPRTTYDVASVAQSWFSTAAVFPFIPASSIFHDGTDFTSFYVGYDSLVSSQTSTWNQRVVKTQIGDEMLAWLGKQSAVLSAVPHIMSCSRASAAGAPQLHIQVSFLTASSAVTSTTNAVYFNTAATMTSAVPASKTPPVVTNTKPSTVNMPSPTTAGVSVGKPTEPGGAPSMVPSDHPSNPPTQPTTVQGGGEGSQQPAPSTAAGFPSSSPPQGSAPSTVTQDAVAPSEAPSDKPSQVASQGSALPLLAPSDNPGTQLAQTTIGQEAGAPSVAPSVGNTNPGTKGGESSGPVIVVIGSVTATALSPTAVPDQEPAPSTGRHALEVPQGTQLIQTSGNVIVPPSQAPSSVAPAPVLIGDATATPIASSALVIGDQTVVPGGPAVVVSSTTYLMPVSQSHVIANGQTFEISSVALHTVSAAPVVGNPAGPVSSGAYALGGQTLIPGGPAIEISGTTYSMQESGGVIVNGNAVLISTVAPQTVLPPIVIGSITATPVASDKYVVADQTLNRGGPAIVVSGTTYSLPPSVSNAIVNGEVAPMSTIQASLQPPATVVIGDVTARPESSGAYYMVADQTLNPGSAVEISGVTYSLPTPGANVVINGATSFAGQTDIPTVSAVVLGSATAVPLLAGGYVVGSQVISPGGSAVEISGTLYSLPTSGSSVVIDGKTTAIQAITPDAVLTVGTQIYTAVAASGVPLVIASQTLIPGGSAVTVSGTVFSLPPDATGSIVVNGQTTSFTAAASGAVELSIGSQQLSFTPLRSGIIIASQTLYPGGPAITVKGETLSIPTDGTVVVVQSGTSTTTEGIGDYVWQGIASPTLNSGSGVLSGSSTRASVASTAAAVSTGTEGAASAPMTTSDASGKQHALGFKSAAMALLVCLFAVVLW